MATELPLFEHEFQTTRPPNPLYCHTDFLEKLSAYRTQPLGKRATLLLQRLAVDERRLHYKATHGDNRGWRRSRLGGAGGSHFYAWWAPRMATPLRNAGGFDDAPEGALFLRDIRHHDDHSPLNPQSFADSYLPLTVAEIRRQEYSPEPWNVQQARFAGSRQTVRLLKGHPGSGKTTALLHAADSAAAERVLYLTYSPELAALARDYFDRYCSSARHFHVAPFSTFVRQWLGLSHPVEPEAAARRRFHNDLQPFLRYLTAWAHDPQALFDELHAHIAGGAVPRRTGRFDACSSPRVADRPYQARRARFLGPTATRGALDAVARLEKAAPQSLAERYFPELDLAWRAACGPVPEALLQYDCIAVDECQDLTPLESFLLVKLAVAIRDRANRPVPILFAGDEAQTVRPTDFEWGWLSDIFHATVGTPSEFRLHSNLRSPRRIADLVNRVWDLYSHIDKKDRPSGAGAAEIDDDATDQLFYCTAAPGPELNLLFADLAAREGMALIALDAVPDAVPAHLRSSVLTASEAKGLDFHSVCVLDAGRQLQHVLHLDSFGPTHGELNSIRKRLAIDRLRVALSRPAERLLWLDISPDDKTVRESLQFLAGHRLSTGLSALAPAALLTMLEEEELDLEERIQRCQSDARQYLAVRPDLAWSRAHQAAALVGEEGALGAVADPAVRRQAWLTLAEVCFRLGWQGQRLSPEFGRPDLFNEARWAAVAARRTGLAQIIGALGAVTRSADPLAAIFEAIQLIAQHRNQLESWLLLAIEPSVNSWVDRLEAHSSAGNNCSLLLAALPPFYEAIGLPDAETRLARLRKRSIDMLMKGKKYEQALEVLNLVPERQPKLIATCLEALGRHARAAEVWREAGQLSQALDCYRAAADFDSALALVRDIGSDHPAAASLQWVARLKQLVAERPDNFTRVMKPSEKKLLEALLEEALGAKRKTPAKKKTVSPPAKPRRRSD